MPTGGPFLPISGGTMTGPTTLTGGVTISGAADPNTTLYVTSTGSAWPAIKWNSVMQGTAAGYFESQRNGLSRWSVAFGTSETETGADAGTNFNSRPFHDDGSPQPILFEMLRANRTITMTGALTLTTPVATAGYGARFTGSATQITADTQYVQVVSNSVYTADSAGGANLGSASTVTVDAGGNHYSAIT